MSFGQKLLHAQVLRNVEGFAPVVQDPSWKLSIRRPQSLHNLAKYRTIHHSRRSNLEVEKGEITQIVCVFHSSFRLRVCRGFRIIK